MQIDQKHHEMLRRAAEENSLVYLSGRSLQVTFQLRLTEAKSTYLLLDNSIPAEHITSVMKAKDLSLQVEMVRFRCAKLETDGLRLRFPLEDDAIIEETRQSERFSFTAEERVVCEVFNPFDQETRLTKTVMDLSANGLSLRTTFDSALFEPGVTLPELKIIVDGKNYRTSAGNVVYKRRIINVKGQQRLQVGIQLD